MSEASTAVAPKTTSTPTTTAAKVDPTKPQNSTTITAPPFKIVALTSSSAYIKCLFYGIPGSGKTTLAGSSVDVDNMQDVLLVNCEAGSMSITEAEHIVNREYVDEVRAQDFKTVAHILDFLKAHCDARERGDIDKLKALQGRIWGYSPSIVDATCEDDEFTVDEDGIRTYTRVRLRKYRTVILDSLTEINAYLIYQLLGITIDTKLDADAVEETAGWDEYKKGNQMFQMLLRAYRDLPMNFLAIAGTQYNQDENKVMHWAPSLLGKLANQVQGFFDIVGYLKVSAPKDDKPQEIPRVLWIQPVGRFAAKTRLAAFKDPSIPNPSMLKIMKIFRERTKTHQKPTKA